MLIYLEKDPRDPLLVEFKLAIESGRYNSTLMKERNMHNIIQKKYNILVNERFTLKLYFNSKTVSHTETNCSKIHEKIIMLTLLYNVP
jgi:putative salt-induced outer membrane protein YdiY